MAQVLVSLLLYYFTIAAAHRMGSARYTQVRALGGDAPGAGRQRSRPSLYAAVRGAGGPR